MPLDFSGDGSRRHYEALLIVPLKDAKHFGHVCHNHLWIDTAYELAARKQGIKPSQIHAIRSTDIFPGQLTPYAGRIYVLGSLADEHQQFHEYLRPVRGYWHGCSKDIIKTLPYEVRYAIHEKYPYEEVLEFPEAVQQLISEDHPFDAIITLDHTTLAVCGVDVEASKKSYPLILGNPSFSKNFLEFGPG
jgi:hypothetical protein